MGIRPKYKVSKIMESCHIKYHVLQKAFDTGLNRTEVFGKLKTFLENCDIAGSEARVYNEKIFFYKNDYCIDIKKYMGKELCREYENCMKIKNMKRIFCETFPDVVCGEFDLVVENRHDSETTAKLNTLYMALTSVNLREIFLRALYKREKLANQEAVNKIRFLEDKFKKICGETIVGEFCIAVDYFDENAGEKIEIINKKLNNKLTKLKDNARHERRERYEKDKSIFYKLSMKLVREVLKWRFSKKRNLPKWLDLFFKKLQSLTYNQSKGERYGYFFKRISCKKRTP